MRTNTICGRRVVMFSHKLRRARAIEGECFPSIIVETGQQRADLTHAIELIFGMLVVHRDLLFMQSRLPEWATNSKKNITRNITAVLNPYRINLSGAIAPLRHASSALICQLNIGEIGAYKTGPNVLRASAAVCARPDRSLQGPAPDRDSRQFFLAGVGVIGPRAINLEYRLARPACRPRKRQQRCAPLPRRSTSRSVRLARRTGPPSNGSCP